MDCGGGGGGVGRTGGLWINLTYPRNSFFSKNPRHERKRWRDKDRGRIRDATHAEWQPESVPETHSLSTFIIHTMSPLVPSECAVDIYEYSRIT